MPDRMIHLASLSRTATCSRAGMTIPRFVCGAPPSPSRRGAYQAKILSGVLVHRTRWQRCDNAFLKPVAVMVNRPGCILIGVGVENQPQAINQAEADGPAG